MPLAVWADSPDVPNKVCLNARLRGAKTNPVNPDSETYGQGGWDIGLHFKNLTELADQLTMLQSQAPAHMCDSPRSSWSCNGDQWSCPAVGKVTRLAINAHGVPGTLYTGGTPSADLVRDPEKERLAISVENIPNIRADLDRIYSATAPNATILLMGCIAGQGGSGTQLLKALAEIWPQRKIVAFETIGLQNPLDMARPGMWGESCTEPGMRDTLDTSPRAPGSAQPSHLAKWNKLNEMPWASETSIGAKVIENGVITKGLSGF